MDIRYEKIRDEVGDVGKQGHEMKLDNEAEHGQQAKQHHHQEPPSPPLSASSSPSHEFSFTISVHHPSAATETSIDDKTKSPPSSSSFAVDLSPADEIFFHGHLLPLHLLSQLHVSTSPRSSTNSLDSFTLPLKDYTQERILHQSRIITNNSFTTQNETDNNQQINSRETRTRPSKSKSFSFFGLQKWRKGCELKVEKEEEEQQHHPHEERKSKRNNKLRFDISHVLKRYIRMVRPLLSFRSRRSSKTNIHFQKQSYSFSGDTSFREKEIRGEGRRRRIQYSAPASIRTSPNNSGPLLANSTIAKTTSDSTMEELQAAIQAAIAHCKNSIAMEDKKKSHDQGLDI